jgi:N-acetylglucosaminyldiphosphoundecaprenol N-acetyl-beta-D-mannosaminyltransferase
MLNNFARPVYCVLGLPFDAVALEEAVTLVDMAARSGQRCFLSTPNLNFLINSLTDVEFRDSVIRSDLSVADGMPLVWIARLLGVPLPERVAGSSIFDSLRKKSGLPLSIYFFGGPDGVAKQACEKLNSTPSGLVCVGYQSPGFGSIVEMSNTEVIEGINTSRADFLVVALGAKKGQAWIEHNLASLKVSAVSHLGAVVNFVAGTVSRAPVWLQRTGMEWLWRIKEEPSLWRRYFTDGLALLKLLATRILPAALYFRIFTPGDEDFSLAGISVSEEGELRTISLSGAWGVRNLSQLSEAFVLATLSPCSIYLDFGEVTHVDSRCIGLLMLLYGHQSKIRKNFSLKRVRPNVARLFRFHGAGFLLNPVAADDR